MSGCVPSGFIKFVLDVCSAWVPLSVSVMCSPAEINLRTIWRRWLLHITTPCRQPDLVVRSTLVNGLTFGGSSLILFKGFGPKDGATWELHPVFGVYWFIPPLLAGPISNQPPLRGGFFPVYTWVGMTLIQGGVVSFGWRLDGVRIWKLSRTYPDEKPPSLSVLMHIHSLATRKPTRHLLAMPRILVRIGATYEGGWSTQFHLPRNYGTIFNPRFLNI